MKSVVIRSISLPADLATWIEESAAAENRSVSSFVNAILLKERVGKIAVVTGETEKAKEETV